MDKQTIKVENDRLDFMEVSGMTYEQAKRIAKEKLQMSWREINVAFETDYAFTFNNDWIENVGGELPIIILKDSGRICSAYEYNMDIIKGDDHAKIISDPELGKLTLRKDLKKQIKIVKNGVTKLDTEIIVNAANDKLMPGGGVCGAIFKEAGYTKLLMACKKIGVCATGSAVITPGFDLNAKYIIHAVGPIWKNGRNNEAQLLRDCYQAAMILTAQNECKSIGFPLISSGIYGYPKEEAWKVAIQTVADFLCGNDGKFSDKPDEYYKNIEVQFAVLDDEMYEMGNRILSEILG